MKKITIVAITLFFKMTAFTQTVIPLYDKVPNLKETSTNLEKIPVKGEVSDVTIPTLTIFQAEKSNACKTAILILPGGGYSHLAMEKEGYDVAKAYNKIGITAFVLKYRMPLNKVFNDSKFVPLQDAEQAMYLIRKNASNYKIDPNNVGIIGFSAGGHLASTLLVHSDTSLISNEEHVNLLPNWALLGYPVITMSLEYGHTGSRKNLIGNDATQSDIDYFSNQLHITNTTPPSFLFLASDDKTVNPLNSILFYEGLLKNKINAEMHIYQNGGHGFGLNNKTTKESWLDASIDWLQQNKFIP
jgi:acetyl esterase/lipase